MSHDEPADLDAQYGASVYLAGPPNDGDNLCTFVITAEEEPAAANARLIAAAPELLEACKGVVSDIEAEHGPHDQEHCPNHHHSLPLCFYCVARAAIAKTK